MFHSLQVSLSQGIQVLDMSLNDIQQNQLLKYLELLAKWNKTYNLTAVRDPKKMFTHHLLDSLAAIKPLQRQTSGRKITLLDAGSGGGLPGVVIAICCPEVEVTCIDAVAKKVAFIRQVAGILDLQNLHMRHARVQTITEPFDVIISRAFASLADFVHWSTSALEKGGVWLAMKGKNPAEEIAQLPASVEVFHVEQLNVPKLDMDRCLVWIRPSSLSKNERQQ